MLPVTELSASPLLLNGSLLHTWGSRKKPDICLVDITITKNKQKHCHEYTIACKSDQLTKALKEERFTNLLNKSFLFLAK